MSSEIPPLTDSDNSNYSTSTESDDESEEVFNSESSSGSGRSCSDRIINNSNTSSGPHIKSAEDLKSEGNDLFGEGNYLDAIKKYEEAILKRISREDKAKCYSNIAHCHNKRLNYDEAISNAFKSMDAQSQPFVRAFQRCAESFIGLKKDNLAAAVLMKGLAIHPKDSTLRQKLMEINVKAKNEAEEYIKEMFKGDAKELDIKSLYKTGFQTKSPSPSTSPGREASPKKKSPPRKVPPQQKRFEGVPELVRSSSDDSGTSSDDDDDDNLGPRKNPNEKKIFSPNNQSNPNMKSKPEPDVANKTKIDTVKKPSQVESKTLGIYNEIAIQASKSYIGSLWTNCRDKYAECLTLMQNNYDAFNFNCSRKANSELVVVKFLFARASTETTIYPDIIAGYEKLRDIEENHMQHVRFPALYLGFALLFKKLNRFEKALTFAEKGVEWFDKNIPCVMHCYPGMPLKAIEETSQEYLKEKFCELSVELKFPLKPYAICKYINCLKVNENNHILPSEKIYKSDPDFKSIYKIMCADNCILDYHESCWLQFKADYTNNIKGVKIPSEKDFLGLKCFTPDCGEIILRIIIESLVDKKVIEDKKIIEKFENDKKEAEKLRREKELRDFQQRKLEARSKKSKKKERNRSKSSSAETEEIKKMDDDNIKPNLEKVNITENLPDLSAVPVQILNRKVKDDIEEDVVDKKKIKKQKERNVLSLEEFTGTRNVDNKIERLDREKKKVELNSIYNKENNSLGTNNSLLNPQAVAFKPPIPPRSRSQSREPIPIKMLEDSIKSFVFDKLKAMGPMKSSDSRLTKSIEPDGIQLIKACGGLVNFMKSDDRVGSYDDYLCVKGDAEKAKKLKEADEKKLNEMAAAASNHSAIGDTARRLKERMEKEMITGIKNKPSENEDYFGLAKVSEQPSLLDQIKEKAEASNNVLARTLAPTVKTEGVQTDVSTIDLDEHDDPISLKETKNLLMLELQDEKDKLSKIQNEKKLEIRELTDKNANLMEKNAKLIGENEDLKETIQKRDSVFKEANKTLKELKVAKDGFDSERKKNEKLEAELRQVKRTLENEQKLTFTQQRQLQKMTDKDNTIKTLKLKCLKTDYDSKKVLLDQKLEENSALIANLNNLSASEASASAGGIRTAIDKLSSYGASLYMALDNLGERYRAKRQELETSSSNISTVVDFDMSSLASPGLASIELDTLRLLTMSSFNNGARSQPQMPPFSRGSQPTSRPPPGLPSSSSPHQTTPTRNHRSPPAAPFTAIPPSPFPNDARQGQRVLPSGPPPVSVPPPAPVVPQESDKKKKATQKLITQLITRHPSLTEEAAEELLKKVRASNNGKLSGMSIPQIIQGVERFMGIQANEDKDCSICLEEMRDYNSRRLHCGHKFHKACMDEWLASPGGAGNTCPLCRKYVVQDSEFPGLGPVGRRR